MSQRSQMITDLDEKFNDADHSLFHLQMVMRKRCTPEQEAEMARWDEAFGETERVRIWREMHPDA